LLASISHDLAEPRAAMIQASTALTFADLAGYRSLGTWVRCTQAMIAAWWNTPDQVLRYAEAAEATSGIGGIRLAGLQARALAQLGNHDDALALLHTADERRDRLQVDDDLHDLGEVFGFSLARQHYYSAATYAHLRKWPMVQREAEAVLGLYGHAVSSQVWPATMALSQIYLALARLNTDGLDGASDALGPVLAMPQEQRIPQTMLVLGVLQRQLRASCFAGVSAARELDEAIRCFRPSTSGT